MGRFGLEFFTVAALASAIGLAPACGSDDANDGPSAGTGGTTSGGTTSGGTTSGGTTSGGTAGQGQGGEVNGAGGDASGGDGAGGDAMGGSSGQANGGAGGEGGAAIPPPCLGNPLPTVAPDELTFAGLVTTSLGVAIEDATVTAYTVDGDQQIDTDTTGADGAYSLTLDTGGEPLDAYVVVIADGYLDTYLYPAVPLYDDVDVDLLLSTAEQRTAAADIANVTLEADTGLLYAFAFDCVDRAAGATISTDPQGDVRYTVNAIPDDEATSTDVNGSALVFNLPPGDVVLDAEIDGYSLREHTIQVRADVLTISGVIP